MSGKRSWLAGPGKGSGGMDVLQDLTKLAGQIDGLLGHHHAPSVLLTRWQVLVGDDDVLFLDAARDSGQQVAGTRYTFVAVTDRAMCYLMAEHDDQMWNGDAGPFRAADWATPRDLIAWRRPLQEVTELHLGGTSQDWCPNQHGTGAHRAVVRLVGRDLELQLPLPSRAGRHSPDIAPVLALLREAWWRTPAAPPHRGTRG
ncbi:MAG TPA: hypothetical protein VHV82_19550 [Sporichthyaceae bacterium]|jgi:hypothetical protein|nr:hypothetical protein [Sporichthyaceae bacterium]